MLHRTRSVHHRLREVINSLPKCPNAVPEQLSSACLSVKTDSRLKFQCLSSTQTHILQKTQLKLANNNPTLQEKQETPQPKITSPHFRYNIRTAVRGNTDRFTDQHTLPNESEHADGVLSPARTQTPPPRAKPWSINSGVQSTQPRAHSCSDTSRVMPGFQEFQSLLSAEGVDMAQYGHHGQAVIC